MPANAAQAAWIGYWRLWQCYHRYAVDGLAHLDPPGAKVIVGYHGRPLAFDMCMLTVAIHDRLGYLPHGIVHRGLEAASPLKRFTDALGFVTDDGPELAAALGRGEHVVITPGGGQEGCRSFLQRRRVAWGDRTGYVKLARRYDLPIVPVASRGADDTYLGLVDADALGRLLGVPRRWAWALWIGIGPLGFYPLSPPFPVRLRQRIGAPIAPWADAERGDESHESLLRTHRRVVRAVQALLDEEVS